MSPAGHSSLRDTIAAWLTLPHRQRYYHSHHFNDNTHHHVDASSTIATNNNSSSGFGEEQPSFTLVPQMHCPSMKCAFVLLLIPLVYAILAFVSWKKMRSRSAAVVVAIPQQFEQDIALQQQPADIPTQLPLPATQLADIV
ncbi:transmembrane protein, putative [Bodo saltans]|uniref:Transmembrane protein, putative n=1 Tax=Bodo saltans TaxID=75058 RepID=A0A0S4JAN3_BODSA|nr:transmembrane protein, putative [Bodo saltans]|eukprot:CUG87001.1 transmembrane protein, putative [Bodo saltans]